MVAVHIYVQVPVRVVIFELEKIRGNIGITFLLEVIFMIILLSPKVLVLFFRGEIFCKEGNIVKSVKIAPVPKYPRCSKHFN